MKLQAVPQTIASKFDTTRYIARDSYTHTHTHFNTCNVSSIDGYFRVPVSLKNNFSPGNTVAFHCRRAAAKMKHARRVKAGKKDGNYTFFWNSVVLKSIVEISARNSSINLHFCAITLQLNFLGDNWTARANRFQPF